MERVAALFEKIAKDSVLQAKFEEIMVEAEKDGKETAEAKLTAFAKEAGYDVTMEEMKAFFKELATKTEEELSEAELDMVAGGIRSNGMLISSRQRFFPCTASSVTGMGQMLGNCDQDRFPGRL